MTVRAGAAPPPQRPQGAWRTAGELAAALDATLRGDAARRVNGVAGLTEAGESDVTFLQSPRHAAEYAATRAAVVLVPREAAPSDAPAAGATVLEVEAPLVAFARTAALLGLAEPLPTGVHPTAVLGRGVVLAAGVALGPYTVVGDDVVIGAGTVLGAGVVVESQVRLGAGCRLAARVVVMRGTQIGDRVIVHPGAVLGAEGFGFVREADGHRKVPQVGVLVVGDDVEIGANTTIDRGASAPTIIGRGTKIDNLVQIGHNVRVGAHCLLAGQSGIAGSSVLEDDVVLAGQAGVADHLRLGRGVVAGAQAGITGDIEAGQTVSGYPALPHALARRVYAVRKRLPEILARLRAVEAALEASPGERPAE